MVVLLSKTVVAIHTANKGHASLSTATRVGSDLGSRATIETSVIEKRLPIERPRNDLDAKVGGVVFASANSCGDGLEAFE